jgi:ATP-binding protein involved in chromosome partitioning
MHPASHQPTIEPIAGIRHLIAVGSGKGGVGKTTVAVNLAISFNQLGHKTGLLDADVYGPNVPLMLGINETPVAVDNKIQPIRKNDLKVMSMGFLNPTDKPLIWRGPMLHNIIQQFLRGTNWGELEYLVIDLPPGTGDVALSLVQTVPLSGAIVVTTPSDVSLEDARKAVNMFRQVKVEVLGIVENMSYLIAPQSKERIDVFGSGGGKRMADQLDVNYLGELPLDPAIRIGGDTGSAVAWRGSGDLHAEVFYEIARRTLARVAETGGPKGPSMTIED